MKSETKLPILILAEKTGFLYDITNCLGIKLYMKGQPRVTGSQDSCQIPCTHSECVPLMSLAKVTGATQQVLGQLSPSHFPQKVCYISNNW